jgi:hypothetical protein
MKLNDRWAASGVLTLLNVVGVGGHSSGGPQEVAVLGVAGLLPSARLPRSTEGGL